MQMFCIVKASILSRPDGQENVGRFGGCTCRSMVPSFLQFPPAPTGRRTCSSRPHQMATPSASILSCPNGQEYPRDGHLHRHGLMGLQFSPAPTGKSIGPGTPKRPTRSTLQFSPAPTGKSIHRGQPSRCDFASILSCPNGQEYPNGDSS